MLWWFFFFGNSYFFSICFFCLFLAQPNIWSKIQRDYCAYFWCSLYVQFLSQFSQILAASVGPNSSFRFLSSDRPQCFVSSPSCNASWKVPPLRNMRELRDLPHLPYPPCFSRMIVLNCLLFNTSKQLFHVFCPVLPRSWQEGY